MATYRYTGNDDREFPTISVTVKAGETFEAPSDFSANDVVPASADYKKPSAPAVVPSSAKVQPSDSDKTAGE
jgi:hypothetical protein